MAVEAHCAELARRHLIRARGGPVTWPDGTVGTCYEFTHALYQQVAYARLGAGQRIRLHRRLGVGLEAAYGPRAAEIAAELAEHFTRGHDVSQAVQYLYQAAENASHRSAPREVIDLLNRALALCRQLPETSERLHQELAIQMALGPAWMALKGFAAPEAGHAYTRARALCEQVGDTSLLFPTIYGLWLFSLIDGALQTAQELATQLLRLAQASEDSPCLLLASWALATTCWHRGVFPQALTHARHGVALYNPQHHRELALRYVFDPGVACRATGAITLWLLGAPDQALAGVHEALSAAQGLASPLSLAFALATAMVIHQYRREPRATGEQAAGLLALCTTYGPAQYVAMGTLFQGWVLAVQGPCEEALVQMRQSVAAFRATGAAMAWQPLLLTLLAEASAQVGQPEEGVRLLAEAQTVLETTGERWWEAEVHRLRGELLLQHALPETSQAETSLRQALAVARRQQAKSLELRAALSLSRLWQQQGKRAVAHKLLAPIYGWFTEGFDTADLQEAQALLEALRAHDASGPALPPLH
jgi:predicted ATPase